MYNEREKNIARDEALKHAIETLTVNRHTSTVARKSYVRDIQQFILANGAESDRKIAGRLSDDEIDRWESFYSSAIKTKNPSDLKVAYLSGPNPENDIDVMVSYGILPENIWAFESDNKTYDLAVQSALNSKYPFMKIYRGGIEQYLKIISFKFDIIYLDFCATLASKKTISVVRDVFAFQKLETLGVLITNFSLPNKENANLEYRENLYKLAANYLFPKMFTEEFTYMGGGYRESAECYGIDFEVFLDYCKSNEETFYSQLITRVLYDLPSVIIPYQKLATNPTLVNMFFKNFNDSRFDEDYYEDFVCFPNENALAWSLTSQIESESFNKLFSRFKNQLSIEDDCDKLKKWVELVAYFITERLDESIHSDRLEKIRKNWKITDKYLFCDVFLFHQLKDYLIGQLTNPYMYNVEQTKRWMYKAKETEMFMDAITYDECRYILDWMPTIDMLENSLFDWDRQLSLRFSLDAITKQRRWYNEEFFAGTAVVDQCARTFEAKELHPRIIIK